MSQKKKLILSALPEQTDDYSRYEESLTRWDRIIAVGVILALVVAALVYTLTGNDDNRIEDDSQKDSLSIEPVPILDLEEKVSTEPQKEPKASDELVSIDAPSADTQKLIESKAEDISKVLTSDLIVEAVSMAPSKSIGLDTQDPKLSILNKGVTSAVLTLDLNDKDSVDSIPYTLALPEEGIVKVMLFTKMNGLRGKKLFHDWYRNGVRQARVKIPVNVNKQNSYSSKYINAQMLGDWQVKVVDDKAELYVTAEFQVVLP